MPCSSDNVFFNDEKSLADYLSWLVSNETEHTDDSNEELVTSFYTESSENYLFVTNHIDGKVYKITVERFS